MLLDDAVEDHRAGVVEHLDDRLVELGGIVAADALGAEGLGELDEVGQASDHDEE